MKTIKEQSKGPQHVAIVTTPDGYVAIEFENPTKWVAFPPELARDIAQSLIKMADAVEEDHKKTMEH